MSEWSHVRALLSAMLAYRSRRTRNVPPPFRLWIEPTSKCNLKCVMCPTGLDLVPKGGYMEVDLFARIVDEAKPFAHNVNLHHRGESLLPPRLPEMIRIASEAGLKTNLHTNGTLMDERRALAINESGLDLLSFSFDGPDPLAYEQVRPRASFEETRDRIRAFLRVRSQRRSRRPFTVIEAIDFSAGGRERASAQRQLAELFRESPPDRIRVKSPHNWAGDWSPSEPTPTPGPFLPCPFLWYSLTVLWDGTIMPCPQDMQGLLALAKFQEGGLREAWNGEKLVSLREKMAREDVNDLVPCRTCDRIRRPKFLGVPQEEIGQFLRENLFRG